MNMSQPFDAAFYRGHGWDNVTGPDAERARELMDGLHARKQWLSLVGNLYQERLVAEFPGTRCLLPINWLAIPERKFDYVLIRTEPGHSFPEHVHGYGDEIYLVVGGSGTVFLNGKAHEARASDIFHIPPGTAHGYTASADSDTTFDLFVVNAPGVAAELRSRYWATEPIPEEGPHGSKIDEEGLGQPHSRGTCS